LSAARSIGMRRRVSRNRAAQDGATQVGLQSVHVDVNDRGGKQGKHLAEDQPADNADTKGPPNLRANAGTESQRQGAEQSGHRGHHDGTEPQEAGLVDSLLGCFFLFSLRLDGKIDHQNRIFLHDADQQNDSDQRDDAQVHLH